MSAIQFNSDGSVFSDQSADTMRLGASNSNQFNFRPDSGLGIPSAELTAATSRSVVDGDGALLQPVLLAFRSTSGAPSR